MQGRRSKCKSGKAQMYSYDGYKITRLHGSCQRQLNLGGSGGMPPQENFGF